jgi:hypothetical protein
LFVNEFTGSPGRVRSTLGVRFLVSDDSLRRISRACLDIIEASASGEVQGDPGENFSIDGPVLGGSVRVSGLGDIVVL